MWKVVEQVGKCSLQLKNLNLRLKVAKNCCVWAGMESINLILAAVGPCFGFVRGSVDNSGIFVVSGFVQRQGLLCSSLPSPVRGC